MLSKLNTSDNFKKDVRQILSTPWFTESTMKANLRPELDRNFLAILLLQLDSKFARWLDTLLLNLNIEDTVRCFEQEKSFFLKCCYLETFFYQISMPNTTKQTKIDLLSTMVRHYEKNAALLVSPSDEYYKV